MPLREGLGEAMKETFAGADVAAYSLNALGSGRRAYIYMYIIQNQMYIEKLYVYI